MEIKQIIRRILGLKKNESINSLNIQKRFETVFLKPFCRKKYTTDDIISALERIGVTKGSNIFIHSSWDMFYNYNGTPEELIQAIVELVGPMGTVAMPAIPLIRKKIFDVRKTITQAGVIPEVFRNMPGVIRSANVKHSVSAIGPLAQELTKDHHLSKIRFDEMSPFYKMCMNNFKIISMGLPAYFIGTIVHCVEATLFREVDAFGKVFDCENLIEQKYVGYDGEEHNYFEYTQTKVLKSDHYRNQVFLWLYFDKKKRDKIRVSNLSINLVEAKYTYERLCQLAKNGKYLYINV